MPAPSSDTLLDRFESALWGGARPRIEEVLPPGELSLPTLVDLIHIELEFRLKAGEPARVEEYLARFPRLAGTTEVLGDLLAAEYRFRRRREPALGPDEYERRFPHCAGLAARLAPTTRPSTPSPGPVALPQVPGHEVLEELGRGGMGVVYKARHLALDRVVALKMIRAGETADAEEMDRFRREAGAVARLAHPNIVQVHEVGEHQGLPYFSLEFCDAGTLATRLRGGPLPPDEAAVVVETLARAMHHAHERGVVHRDLKPANVLLTAQGAPKITDFGLAKRQGAEGQTQTGAVMGTPSYMAPEQARGEAATVGPAADVYALGAILYECLAGRPPFQAATTLETLRQVVEDEPAPPRLLQPGTPRDLETVCLKCLEKQPERRYDSALALAGDLRRFLDGEPIAARPVGPGERAWKWVRRRPLVAALLAVAVVSLLGGSGAAVGFGLSALESATRATEAKGQAEQKTEEARQKQEDAEREWRRAETEKQNAVAAREEARTEQGRAEAERDRADRRAYGAQVASAYSAWQAGNTAQAMHVLDACRWDLRGWEYRYLYTLFQGRQQSLDGNIKPVKCVAYSPDGLLLASGGYDGAVRLWDARTGRQLRLISAYGKDPSEYGSGTVTAVAFTPDGKQVVAACHEVRGQPPRFAGDIKLFDVQTGKQGQSWQAHNDAVETVAVSPDGKLLASGGSDTRLKIWDAATGASRHDTRAHPNSQVMSVAFSPDSTRVVSSGADRCVRIWDARTGEELKVLTGHAGFVYTAVFSPDGKRIASCAADATVRLWDASGGGKPAVLQGHNSAVTAVAFSPDGKQVASGSRDATVKVWDAASGRVLQSLKGHQKTVAGVAFHPDGKQVASAGEDNSLKIWGVGGQDHLVFRGGNYSVYGLAFSPDGKRVASDGYAVVKVWDPATGQVYLSIPDASGPLAFRPDGRHLAVRYSRPATRESGICLWDAATGREVRTFPGTGGAVAFSPDGTRLATGGDSVNGKRPGEVIVWDVESGREILALAGHGTMSLRIAYSRDGTLLAAGSDDRTVRLWDARTGKLLRSLAGHGKTVTCVAFDPDGRWLAAGGEDRTVRVWEVATGAPVRTLQGHQGPVRAVAFCPDGGRIASGSGDGTVRLWDAESDQETLLLAGHSGSVYCVAFSPDGKQLASGGEDFAVRVWEAAAEPEALVLRGPLGRVGRVASSADGKLILGGGEQRLVVWNARTGQPTFSRELTAGEWNTFALRPDGGRLAAVRQEQAPTPGGTKPVSREVVVWDVERQKQEWTQAPGMERATGVAFSPDGKRLAVAGAVDPVGWGEFRRGRVRVLDADTGREVLSFHGHANLITSVAFSPDGRKLATGSWDNTARIWDSETGKELVKLSGHKGWVQDIAFSPDGSRLATGSWDKSIKVWDAGTGKELANLPGHGDWVTAVAFHPDGRRLVSGSGDYTVRMWDTQVGKELIAWRGHTHRVETVAVWPDGRRVLSGGYDEAVRVWTLPEVR